MKKNMFNVIAIVVVITLFILVCLVAAFGLKKSDTQGQNNKTNTVIVEDNGNKVDDSDVDEEETNEDDVKDDKEDKDDADADKKDSNKSIDKEYNDAISDVSWIKDDDAMNNVISPYNKKNVSICEVGKTIKVKNSKIGLTVIVADLQYKVDGGTLDYQAIATVSKENGKVVKSIYEIRKIGWDDVSVDQDKELIVTKLVIKSIETVTKVKYENGKFIEVDSSQEEYDPEKNIDEKEKFEFSMSNFEWLKEFENLKDFSSIENVKKVKLNDNEYYLVLELRKEGDGRGYYTLAYVGLIDGKVVRTAVDSMERYRFVDCKVDKDKKIVLDDQSRKGYIIEAYYKFNGKEIEEIDNFSKFADESFAQDYAENNNLDKSEAKKLYDERNNQFLKDKEKYKDCNFEEIK